VVVHNVLALDRDVFLYCNTQSQSAVQGRYKQ